MKTIFFSRHSKSSWEFPLITDFDRPLNKRGLRDAPLMSKTLKNLGAFPDFIFSSSAERAKETAIFYKDCFQVNLKDFYLSDELYMASAPLIMTLVRSFSNEYNSGIVIGHNPGFTELANNLKGDYIDNVPTSGVFKVTFNIEKWKDANYETGVRSGFIYPKSID